MAFGIGALLTGAAKAIGGAFVSKAVSSITGGGSSSVGPAAAATPLPSRIGMSDVGGRLVVTGSAEHRRLEPFATPFSGRTSAGPSSFGVTRRLVGTAMIPAAGSLARGAGALAGGIVTLLALSRDRTGRPTSRAKVMAAVKHCGISLAADLFALSEVEICEIIVSKGRRRGRGISAADLRRTRSTIRKVHNIAADLKRLSPARRHHK